MDKRIRTIKVSDSDREELERRTRAKTLPAWTVERARIILLSADGHTGRQVAARIGCAVQSVVAWRNRYEQEGLSGLEDRPRSGRPAQTDASKRSEVAAKTLEPPPAGLGVAHQTSRLTGRGAGSGHSTIARIWNDYDLQPWRLETFKLSTDPQLEAKVRDVVGGVHGSA